MADQQRPRTGYVRCQATHLGAVWQFEVLSEERKTAVATIVTLDGPVQIVLTRESAEALHQQLRLFLLDWPADRSGTS